MDTYGSDKGPRKGDSTHHTYTEVYHSLFKDLTDQSLTVFEMGLGTNNTNFASNMGVNGRPGASLMAWRDYFPNSSIYGADIDKGVLFNEDRIHTTYCDQTNPSVVRSMWESLPDMDIMIDDGLHVFEANVTLFENSIQKLKPSGIYVVEDINHSEIPRFERKIEEWRRTYPNRIFSLRVLSGGNPIDNNILVVRPISISVCIPTMRRFSFLKESIPKYLKNPHVTELVITDETGEDYRAITGAFSHPKLRVYQNETRLGMLKNKLRAASYAASDFVAILDSDNFADLQYFEAFKTFYSNYLFGSSCLFLPSVAKPNFNYRKWIGLAITKNNIKTLLPEIDTCLNTMNLIASKAFLSSIDILTDVPMCDDIGCYDSQYFNLYSMFNCNATLFLVDKMEYEHRVHEGSGWSTTHTEYDATFRKMVDRYLSSNYLKYEMDISTWQRTRKHARDLIVQASSRNDDDAWMSFPIGMNYTYVSGNREQFGSHANTVLCAINPFTDKVRRPDGINRCTIAAKLASNGIPNEKLTPVGYYQCLPSYKFVVSPEGNGVDCHRHYEALVAGCIPIVERNPLVEKKYQGCPILWTTDYSEITHAYLESKYEEMKGRVYDFSRLLLGFYPVETQSEIKKCGNYWMTKHTGSPFYS
jgi:hypothetical protein